MPSAGASRIIVLHLTKYSDRSLIVHAIDSQEGRQSFILHGAGRKAGTRSISDFHSLNILDVISSGRPSGSMRYLREWESVRPLNSLRSDIFKSSTALFISEVLYRSLTVEAADSTLFDWLCSVIETLDSADGSIANFHLWFLSAFCTRMGFEPADNFEPREIFSPEENSLLKRLGSCNFAEAMSIPLNGRTRSGFSRKLIQYLSFHLGARIELRSLDVLHELFE